MAKASEAVEASEAFEAYRMFSLLVLKFPYSSNFGGGERHTLTVVDHLIRRGWKVAYAGSCSILYDEYTQRELPAKKIRLVREPVAKKSLLLFPFVAPYAFARLALLLMTYRFRNKMRAVYCLSLTEKVLATPVARLLGMRIFWVEHVNFGDWINKNPLRFFYRLYARFATIIAVSDSVKRDIIALGVPADRVVVIYNGINVHAAESVPVDHIMRFPRQYVVGSIGRLEKEKGYPFLLKAIATVREVVPHIRLVIVGEGSQKRALQDLAQHLGIATTVHFTGFQKNIYPWLLGFHVFVLPSHTRESSGLVLAEAMSCYVACVGSDLGGIPEIIQHNETGFLVPPGDVRALADTITKLYFNPDLRFRLGKAGRDRVRDKFSEERMLGEFEHTLRER